VEYPYTRTENPDVSELLHDTQPIEFASKVVSHVPREIFTRTPDACVQICESALVQ